MADPRLEVISRRLSGAKRIIAVSSGKGGVGKSMVAASLALCLAQRSLRVGLLDLDFTSPSTHLILGVEGLRPEEDRGIIPPKAHGLCYMSIVYYSAHEPTPLRGADVSEVIIELLAITRWGELDFLVVDMPPGIGDATLDVIRLVKRIEFLVVTTPSRVAYETVRKELELLRRLGVPVLGVVENMVMGQSSYIRNRVEGDDVPYLGVVEYDPRLEDALGDVKKLATTKFFKSIEKVASQLG